MADENSNIKTFPGAGSTPPSRTMPNNLQAEQNLLGAILLDNSVLERIDDRLLADHFYDPFHGRIFATMQRLVERGQLANPVTLKSFFTDSEDFQSDSAESYLSELADGVISITQAPDYAKIIHEAHVRRQLILIGDEVILDASHPEVDVPAHQQIETAESKLFRLADTDSTSVGLRGFDSVISGSITQADLARKSDGHLSGTSTGLTDLNNLLGGLHKSDLIILAGRPGMGKTALATNIAFHAAVTTRTGETAVPVAFFSLEMAAEQLGTRILSERAQVDSEQIRRGKLNSTEFDQLVSASNAISSAPFFIDDTPSLSVSQLASRARRLKRTSGLGLIIVDYLQLLTPQLGVKSENRVQEISNISRTLKAIAKDLNVPVVALSQLSRAVEMRDQYGLDGAMIGRASIGNPWFFNQVKHFIATGTHLPSPTISERVEAARRHLEMSIAWKGEVLGVLETRRHYTNYFKGISHFKEYRTKLVSSYDLDEISGILNYIQAHADEFHFAQASEV